MGSTTSTGKKGKMTPMPKMKKVAPKSPRAGAKASSLSPSPKAKPAKKEAPVAVSAPKKHERKSKPGETARIKDAKKLAQSYLVQRDGMDPDTAEAVVAGLGSEELAELIVEANTAVIERTQQGQGATEGAAGAAHSTEPPSLLTVGSIERTPDTPSAGEWQGQAQQGGTLVGDAGEEDVEGAIDYTTIPALAEVTVPSPWTRSNPTGDGPGVHDELSFLDLTQYAVRLSKAKNEAEKQYKAVKKLMVDLMDFAGAPKVTVGIIKLGRYQGHTMTLNENLLLQAGVAIDLIKKGWKDTPYEDVRIITPKAPKDSKGKGQGQND